MKQQSPSSQTPDSADPHRQRSWRGLVVAVTLCLIQALPLYGQMDGTLGGRITNNDGVPLPGVTVTLRSEQNPSTNSKGAVTGARGEYRIPGLPPGGDYALSASFPGMATVTQTTIRVRGGQLTTVDFMLVEELVERIRVEARGSIVDTTTATGTTTVGEEFIESLPILGRSYTDLLTLAPGVTDTDRDGKPNVYGAREVDFQTRINGLNITDPFGGEEISQINIEAIEEVQLILTGATAEYGRFQGGMSNVITKSGGNKFVGSFKIFYQTRSLDGDGAANRDEVSEAVFNVDLPSFRTLKPFLTFGGALKRDRLWYFLANQYIDQQEPVNLLGVTRNRTYEGWNEYGKLTWQMNASNKATLEGLYDPREISGENIGSSISERSDFRVRRRTPMITARETWVVGPTMFLDTAVSWLDGKESVDPLVSVGLGLPCPHEGDPDQLRICESFPVENYTQNVETGQIAGPYWVTQDSDSTRLTIKQDLSFYVDDFLGNHSFKVGFEWNGEDYNTTVEQRPLRYDFEGGEFQNRLAELNLFAEFENRVSDAEATGRTLGIYVQDSWRIRPNLTLNLGVRIDREDLSAPGHTPFDPAAEREAFASLASQLYCSPGEIESGVCKASLLTFTPANESFYEGLLPGTQQMACDVAGPSPDGSNLGGPDGVCDFWDERALSNVFRRHESELAGSSFFTREPGNETGNLPPCGNALRYGTCRDEADIDLDNTNLAPRISLAYDPFSDGKTKLYASWGRYYDRLFLKTITPEQSRDFYYISFKKEPGNFEAFLDPVPTNFQVYHVDRDLRTPFMDEFTVGFDRELSPEFAVSVRYIRRKGRDQIQTRDINHATIDANFDGLPDDQFIQIDPDGNPENAPDGFPDLYSLNPFFGGIFFLGNVNISDYKAVVLSLVKRLHRNWQFDASYTWSEAVGNAEAFDDFFLGNDTSQIEHEFGFLDYDQRHVVKFSAIAHLPKQMRFGTRITWESGLPFSLLRRDFTFDNFANPTFRQIFPTAQRNDQRNNGRWSFDVNIAKDFSIGQNVRAGVDFAILNLLNSDDLEIGNINDAFTSFQLVDETSRRFGRRFQIGFTMHF